ncbi:MAG: protein kinase [Alphaproteobacteria bacterium]|nr:protein kinase [Alphaproteobacteria bacterium]
MSPVLEPGARVDRYRVEQVLAVGPVTAVYAVRHATLDTPHLLKVLRVDDPALDRELREEARSLARLHHPNVVPVADLLEVDGAPALLMQRVDGPSLAERLEGGPLEPAEAESLLRGILDGVEHAHAQGLVHGDLRPSSVLLATRSGGIVPRITEFGAALNRHQRSLPPGEPDAAPRATPAFMAPEQIADGHVDAQADVFSLGALLYAMLTGRSPFQRETPHATLQAVLAVDRAPLDARLPGHLRAAVHACLVRDPSARPQGCAGVRALLDHPAETPRNQPVTLQPGDIVDRYTVERRLGSGGMAVVYRVRHTELGRPCALKILHTPDPEIRARLRREGRIQSLLEHPNVVQVTDLVDVYGDPGLVMEFVDGPSMDEVLEGGRLTLDQADLLARGILAGVSAAHAQGLVHRDLKPANILLKPTPQGPRPMVADFGLAKLLDSESVALTRSGMIMGTPSYMAPEVFRGIKDVDERVDIFALGVILYEMVCGRAPFKGRDVYELMHAITKGRYTPPQELEPTLPVSIAETIAGALQNDPDRRIPTCNALLASWTAGRPQPDAMAVWFPNQGDAAPAPPRAEPTPAPTPAASTIPQETFAFGDLGDGAALDEAPVAPPAAPTPPAHAVAPPVETPAPPRAGRWVAALAVLGAVAGGGWWATRSGPAPTVEVEPAQPAVTAPTEPEPPAPAQPDDADEPEITDEPTAAPLPSEPAREPPRERSPAVVAVKAPPPDDPPVEPVAAPEPGEVRVDGDVAEAWLMRDGTRYNLGEVPPGDYRLFVSFAGEEGAPATDLSVRPGQSRTVLCNAALKKCR